MTIQDSSWNKVLKSTLASPEIKNVALKLQRDRESGHNIFPSEDRIFAAFDATPFDQVRVVILGQDPYPTAGHANGLSFSVSPGVQIPRSLQNIYKELEADLGITRPSSGDLTPWTRQGVLLLNSVLTVREGHAHAHEKYGWQFLTERAIKEVSLKSTSVAFILWGAYARRQKQVMVRGSEFKHLILESAHPSPLSARRGFFGSGPFSQVNQFFRLRGEPEIDWRL